MALIKVGERVVIPTWKQMKVFVSRIFFLDNKGIETKYKDDAVQVMLELDWGEFGKSKVSVNDENKLWHRYSSSN